MTKDPRTLEINADYHTAIALMSQYNRLNTEKIASFVQELKSYSNSKLFFPVELEAFLLETDRRGLQQAFRDAMFHAKFAVKTQEVMRRIGPGTDGFDKLATEFNSSTEKASSLLKTILKETEEETKHRLVNAFFSMNQESLGNLFKLFSDLAWVKNWEVDGKPLPW